MSAASTRPHDAVVASASGPTTRVDVIVATRDRPDDLAHLLPTLAAQTHGHFRVLVMDQSDDVEPNRAAIAALADPRFVHVAHSARGKSRALNDGLARTDSELVAFTDDDCELPARWLAAAVAAMQQAPHAGVLFGDVTAFAHDASTHFVPALSFPRPATLRGPMTRSPGLIGMGANMVVRRSALAVAGSFDTDLGPGGRLSTGEEVELAYRVLRAGFDVVQQPAVSVIHRGARRRAGRVAADLITTGFFAIGCGYGKNLRDGDLRAAVVAGDEALRAVGAVLTAIAQRRPPFHLRRLGAFLRGVIAGFAAGPRIPAGSPR